MPLTDNLVSLWRMEEASGNRADSWGSNTLVDNNTVGQTTGKLGNAADLVEANDEYFSLADNASLDYTIGLTIVGWVWFDALTNTQVISKFDVSGNGREFAFDAAGAGNKFRFYTSTSGTGPTTAILTSSHAATTGAWTFFALRIDMTGFPGDCRQQLRINSNAWEEIHTNGDLRVFNGGADVRLGTRDLGATDYMDGRLDDIAWFDNVLSDAEVDELWNSGNGLAWPWGGITDQLEGSSVGSSAPSGVLSRAIAMNAASAGVTTPFSTLAVQGVFNAQSDGVATVTGSLSGPASVSGQSDGVATASATLGLRVPLEGGSDGDSDVSDGGALDGGSGPPGIGILPRPDDIDFESAYTGVVRLFVDDVEVPKADRKGLRWSSVSPGGDDRLSVDVDCRSEFFTELGGLPLQRSHVELQNELGDIIWTGWLRKPVIAVAYGVFNGLRLEAEGYQYSGLVEPFEEHQVYGPASVGSSSLDKTVTASIVDAMDHARTQKTPLITGTRYVATGFNFDEDTESFFGKVAVDVWNTCNAMLGYLDNPLYWQVYSIDNLVTLEFFPHSGAPDYFEQGRAKEMALEFDANDVIWRCAVAFGGEQVYVAPATPVTPAIATPYTQGKVLNLEAEARSLNQITLVGESVVSKLNEVRITGGSLTIDQAINTVGCANMPPLWLRAGRMIEVTIPVEADPYNTNDTDPPGTISGRMYIQRCECEEESCTATLSASPYTDEAKAIRQLPFQSTPGLTWGIAIGTFNSPVRTDKLPFVGSTPDPARFDPSAADSPIVGSMIPTGYKTDSQHDFGPTGGIYDPSSMPKNVVTANYWITGLITAAGPPPVYAVIVGENGVVAQPIPEMVVERIELLAVEGGPGSITLQFNKFTRASETITTDYLTAAALSNETFSETVIPSSDPDPGDPDTRKTFRTGDFIIIDVVGDPEGANPVNIKKLAVGIFGRKISESYAPRTQGPGWVERPASPSWPHNAGWS